MCNEGRLYGMQHFALGETLDRRDLSSIETGSQRQAGIDPPAADDYRASAALAAVAALLRASETKALPQQVEQRDAWIVDLDHAFLTVDFQADGKGH
jgi:hypothetical protein